MKYQGGYQIIDLSGDNIFAKAQSAFETNKPVLVYDGGIASFGNVTKSSTNFVINYIIDDKLYQATVAADNTVTKTSIDLGDSSSDIEALETAVAALESNNLQTGVDISTYDGSTEEKLYTVPADGYIRMGLVSQSSTDGALVASIQMTNGTVSVLKDIAKIYTTGTMFNTFVKKGMKVRVLVQGGVTNSILEYYALG